MSLKCYNTPKRVPVSGPDAVPSISARNDNIHHARAKVMVTGGAGFTGSNFIRHVLGRSDFTGTIVNYDKLTYAGNLVSLSDVADQHGGKRYVFERGDVCDYDNVQKVLVKYDIALVVHCAAESHVDRLIFGQKEFVEATSSGTFSLPMVLSIGVCQESNQTLSRINQKAAA